MKKIIVPLLLLCVFQVYGQDRPVATNSWKLSAIGARAQQNYQHHTGMSFKQFQKDAHDPKGVDFDMSNYNRDYVQSNYMENFGLFIRWSKLKREQVTQDLEVELDYTDLSELYTEYTHKDDPNEFMGWCLMQSRISLAVKYLTNFRKNSIGLRVGPSIGLAASFNDDLIILTPDYNAPEIIVDAKSNVYLTSHLQLQLYFVLLNRLEFGIGGKAGGGTQFRNPNLIGSGGLDASFAYTF